MSLKQYAIAWLASHVLTTWATCAPGYYMPILEDFQLQLPYDTDGSVTYISGSELAGCDGYQNSSWFYWNETNNHLVMNAPPSDTDCAMTPGSKHCRTELREDSPSSWSPTGTNTMTVTLVVAEADDSYYGTVIGQVFCPACDKPVAELYYAQTGVITMGVEQSTSGGDEDFTANPTVIPQGTEFTYELSYSDDVLSLTLNGGTPSTYATSQLGYPDSYFKVGNYNQGTTTPSKVDVYSITIVHS